MSAAPESPPPENDLSLNALVAGAGHYAVAQDTGEVENIGLDAAANLLQGGNILLCHAGFVSRRLRQNRPARRKTLFDVLELFAFTYPARFCVPNPAGLANALGLSQPTGLEEEAASLHLASAQLLGTLTSGNFANPEQAARLALHLARAGWAWGPKVVAALQTQISAKPGGGSGLEIWNLLPEWEERAPEPPAGTKLVGEAETETRLKALVGLDGEVRASQIEYAKLAAKALVPKDNPDAHGVVLAEAGTGLGKTLGYLAPISLWAEKNGPGVWIATYTKNLQRQLDQELSKLYPDPVEKARWTTIRKGRENYLCLLNYQEAATRSLSTLAGMGQVEIALIARWALASRDGDMVGGDYPAWLETGFEGQLTDRRGECIYSACPHYKRCVIEKSVRKARRARIVVANHALVLMQAAIDRALPPSTKETQDDGGEHRRFLFFDEGHHLFNAADAAFSAHLTGLETSELRRWIRGPEGRRGSRARGLVDRIGDLTGGIEEIDKNLQTAVKAARALPFEGWQTRLVDGTPEGPAETLFTLVRLQIAARSENGNRAIQRWEADIRPLAGGIAEAASELDYALEQLLKPLGALAKSLRARLDDEAEDLESSVRIRIEAAARGLERRSALMLPSWRSMLYAMTREQPEEFVDWFAMENLRGRLFDVGMHRHWVDPTEPLATTVLEPAQGVFVTSATLRDVPEQDEEGATQASWDSAEVRTGMSHLAGAARRESYKSPFDYAKNTRVLVVNDLTINDADQVSAAFRELFKASGGGALGLFTAIHRLRAVHERIAEPMEALGLPLYAQHVDAMDTGTLVDIFRSDENACLLGTDAVRDGIDVPGSSLRLIVFDRVPWPRPDILHKARRERFGKRTYDDLLTRLKLKQAFGRLVRRQDDRGLFVVLDARTPTRLLSALPEGVEISRLGLADAVAATAEFLNPSD